MPWPSTAPGAVLQLRSEHFDLINQIVHIPASVQKGANNYSQDKNIYLDEETTAHLMKIKESGLIDLSERKDGFIIINDQQ